jgi:hypothetical protein
MLACARMKQDLNPSQSRVADAKGTHMSLAGRMAFHLPDNGD